MSGITGDFAELAALEAHLRGLAEAPARALTNAAPEIQRVARAGYAANRGPGGVSWPRNTSNNRYPSLERPAAGVTFSASGTTLLGEAEDVLKYHGGPERNLKLPERAVFPADGEIPPEWAAEVERALREELDR